MMQRFIPSCRRSPLPCVLANTGHYQPLPSLPCFIVILICISQITNELEHIFRVFIGHSYRFFCILTIYIPCPFLSYGISLLLFMSAGPILISPVSFLILVNCILFLFSLSVLLNSCDFIDFYKALFLYLQLQYFLLLSSLFPSFYLFLVYFALLFLGS